MENGTKSMEQKFKNDKSNFTRITNDDLVCGNCEFRMSDSQIFGNTSRCKKFSLKPNEVLSGGECNEYKKENTK